MQRRRSRLLSSQFAVRSSQSSRLSRVILYSAICILQSVIPLVAQPDSFPRLANPRRLLAGLTSDRFVVSCFAPGGGKIAFNARCSLDRHDALYLIRPDGTGLEQAYSGDSPAYYPSWSPDGAFICFNAGSSLYEYNVNTGRTEHVLTDALKWSATPAYSRDSREIIYRAMSGLRTWDRSLGRGQVLTRKPGDRQPAPNPNGKEIALVGNDDDDVPKLFLITTDGGGRKEITLHPGNFSHPSWSPDGELLLFDRTLDQQCNLYVVDRRTGIETRLTSEDSAAAQFACFAPDGRTIVYVRQDKTGQSLYLADFETGPQPATGNQPPATNQQPPATGDSSVAHKPKTDTLVTIKPDTSVRRDTTARESGPGIDRSRYKIVAFSDDNARAREFLDSLRKIGYTNPDNYVAGNPTPKAVIKSNHAPDEVVQEITDLCKASLDIDLEPVDDPSVPETTIYINLP